MYSTETIKEINRQAGKTAGRTKIKPYRAKSDEDEGVFKCPFIGDFVLTEFETTDNLYFVDSSGFGRESEPAMTIKQFLKKVRKNYYYAIVEHGQFQVYIQEYIKK